MISALFTVLYIFMTSGSNICLVRSVLVIFCFPKRHFVIQTVFKVCDNISCWSVSKICDNISEQLKRGNSYNSYVWHSDIKTGTFASQAWTIWFRLHMFSRSVNERCIEAVVRSLMDMKFESFIVVTCTFVDRYQCFGWMCCLHTQCRRWRQHVQVLSTKLHDVMS